MTPPKRFLIKEDMATLRTALRHSKNEMLRKRVRTLMVFKKHERTGISKRAVARLAGIDPDSAQNWRDAYMEGGLTGLLAHEKKSNRVGQIKPHHREALREKLHDPQNGLRGFTELLAWFNAEFGAQVKYHAMNKFVKRNYGALCKVARKSHVKKDPEAVGAFKKTSRSNAPSSVPRLRAIVPV